MKKFIKPLVLFLIVITAGCGYHFVKVSGEVPPDVRNVYIPPFKNLTGESDIGFVVAAALSRQFIKTGMFVPSNKEDADAEIIGVIKSVKYSSRVYDNRDLATLIRVGIVIDITFQRIGGDKIWEVKGLGYTEDFKVAGGSAVLDVNKGSALKELADELALEIHDRVLLGQ